MRLFGWGYKKKEEQWGYVVVGGFVNSRLKRRNTSRWCGIDPLSARGPLAEDTHPENEKPRPSKSAKGVMNE
jgi:hypothetical protein